LFFLIYINDLPNIIAEPSKPILFADDTNTNPSPSKFKKDINNIILYINDWFRGYSLSLNFDKMYFLQNFTFFGPCVFILVGNQPDTQFLL